MAARDMIMLLVLAGLTAAAAVVGSQFEPGEWYAALQKPALTPPPIVFPVVWTTLYVLIAISGFLAWRAGGWSVAIALWLAQMVLNGLWSWLAFGLQRLDLSAIDIVVLLAVIIAYIVAVAPVSRWAAWLFVPYAAWVGLATWLNIGLWQLNPGASATGL